MQPEIEAEISITDSAPEQERRRARVLSVVDKIIIVWLIVFASFAPHSIAVAQSSMALAVFFWLVRAVVRKKLELERTPVDYALLGFFAFTVLAAFFSVEPVQSIGKLRAASLFVVFYLFAQAVRSQRVARALICMVLISSAASVIYVTYQKVVGRGLRIDRIFEGSPLSVSFTLDGELTRISSGDILLRANKIDLRSLDDLSRAFEESYRKQLTRPDEKATVHLEFQRYELLLSLDIQPDAIAETVQRRGRDRFRAEVSPGREFRAMGFFHHPVTFAEVYQFIASLALGVLLGLKKKLSPVGALVALLTAGLVASLVFSATRAALIGFIASAIAMSLMLASRRVLALALIAAMVIIAAGAYVLPRTRGMQFLGLDDGSARWRKIVYRDGLRLVAEYPLFGVGMDSIKWHWREWNLFDSGRIPIGHFHSTPLQIAVERGLITLALYIAMMVIFFRMSFQLAKQLQRSDDWLLKGFSLGALGGLVGFNVSSLVHYNFGDSEVAMMLWFVMGLVATIKRQSDMQKGRGERRQ